MFLLGGENFSAGIFLIQNHHKTASGVDIKARLGV